MRIQRLRERFGNQVLCSPDARILVDRERHARSAFSTWHFLLATLPKEIVAPATKKAMQERQPLQESTQGYEVTCCTRCNGAHRCMWHTLEVIEAATPPSCNGSCVQAREQGCNVTMGVRMGDARARGRDGARREGGCVRVYVMVQGCKSARDWERDDAMLQGVAYSCISDGRYKVATVQGIGEGREQGCKSTRIKLFIFFCPVSIARSQT